MDECSHEARKSAPKERVEVTMRRERRRWSAEEKLQIVPPNASASVVADLHGIGTRLFYTWPKQMPSAAMTGFAAVEVSPEPQRVSASAPPSVPEAPAQGSKCTSPATEIAAEVSLPDGTRARVGKKTRFFVAEHGSRLLQGRLRGSERTGR